MVNGAGPETQPLVFGVYPFGTVGGPGGVVSGPPDDFGRIGAALAGLAGDGPPLLLRMYVMFEGAAGPALDQVAQFAGLGSLVDLSLSFHDRGGDVDGWCSFVQEAVRRHGSAVSSIGVTNEANLAGIPFAPDGAYPNALEALVDGVLAAAEAKRAAGASAALGFTAAGDAVNAGDGDAFWPRVAQRNGAAFAAALDFAGLTLYPGGFGPRPPAAAELARAATGTLTAYRAQLAAAGIPGAVPVRVSECGWPTGPGRSAHGQAEALAVIVAAVARLRGELGITHWELFTLRDADSRRPDAFGQFGVLRDDYTPKPAYAALRELIAAHGHRVAG
jgi:hypothetical protein